jgi:hypothetical protein
VEDYLVEEEPLNQVQELDFSAVVVKQLAEEASLEQLPSQQEEYLEEAVVEPLQWEEQEELGLSLDLL